MRMARRSGSLGCRDVQRDCQGSREDRPRGWPAVIHDSQCDNVVRLGYGRECSVYHSAVAEKRTTSAERVREDIERLHGVRLKVPERTPRRVSVDLERVILRTVKEDDEGGRDDNSLESNDARRRVLEVEAPTQ